MAVKIYENEFSEKVLSSPLPTLVDFYSDSCVACKKLAPTLCDVEEDYEGKVNVFKVNTAHSPQLVEDYGIQSNPTLIFFKDGKAVDKKIGARDYDEITDWVDGLL